MRELTRPEIDAVLSAEDLGRLGLYDRGADRVYVVPISYVYDDQTLFFHSAAGLKLDLLKAHPDGICFQVDQIAAIGEWLSVVAWGRFEEIGDQAERQGILHSFGDRLFKGPLRDHQNVGRAGQLGAGETVYRIQLTELTGRTDSHT